MELTLQSTFEGSAILQEPKDPSLEVILCGHVVVLEPQRNRPPAWKWVVLYSYQGPCKSGVNKAAKTGLAVLTSSLETWPREVKEQAFSLRRVPNQNTPVLGQH